MTERQTLTPRQQLQLRRHFLNAGGTHPTNHGGGTLTTWIRMLYS